MNESGARSEHEHFVTGHSGGSILEISLIISSGQLCFLLLLLIRPHLLKSITRYSLCGHMLEFSFIVLPLLAVTTLLSDLITLITTSLITLCLSILVTSLVSSKTSAYKQWLSTNLYSTHRNHFITCFRSYTNIVTAVCILAVDFPIFPRRFAKAETYGTGLMDVGVGCYIIANALVSKEARKASSQAGSAILGIKRIAGSVFSTWPLLLLGIGRLVSVKGTNYQEHVTEYGVHWNFFFTLAAVRILSTVILTVLSSSHSWLISLTLALMYQYSLTSSTLDLSGYIQNGSDGLGSRHLSLLDANREGVLSSVGYLSIYFCGVQIGSYIARQRGSVMEWCRVLVVLISLDVLLWLLLYTVQSHVDVVSRRMANLPFIIWMVAFSVQTVTLFLFIDLLISFTTFCRLEQQNSTQSQYNKNAAEKAASSRTTDVQTSEPDMNPDHSLYTDKHSQKTLNNRSNSKSDGDTSELSKSNLQESSSLSPKSSETLYEHCTVLMEAVNRNALIYFLMSNVLTGLVNMMNDTIHASTLKSLTLMILYLITLNLVTVLLHVHNITIKFW